MVEIGADVRTSTEHDWPLSHWIAWASANSNVKPLGEVHMSSKDVCPQNWGLFVLHATQEGSVLRFVLSFAVESTDSEHTLRALGGDFPEGSERHLNATRQKCVAKHFATQLPHQTTFSAEVLFGKRNLSPFLVSVRQFGKNFIDNLGEADCEPTIASRQQGAYSPCEAFGCLARWCLCEPKVVDEHLCEHVNLADSMTVLTETVVQNGPICTHPIVSLLFFLFDVCLSLTRPVRRDNWEFYIALSGLLIFSCGFTPPCAFNGFALSLSSLSARCCLSISFASCLHVTCDAVANMRTKNGGFAFHFRHQVAPFDVMICFTWVIFLVLAFVLRVFTIVLFMEVPSSKMAKLTLNDGCFNHTHSTPNSVILRHNWHCVASACVMGPSPQGIYRRIFHLSVFDGGTATPIEFGSLSSTCILPFLASICVIVLPITFGGLHTFVCIKLCHSLPLHRRIFSVWASSSVISIQFYRKSLRMSIVSV